MFSVETQESILYVSIETANSYTSFSRQFWKREGRGKLCLYIVEINTLFLPPSLHQGLGKKREPDLVALLMGMIDAKLP